MVGAVPDLESENAQLLWVIDAIQGSTQGRGIYVMDRSVDRIKLFNPLLDRSLRFIVRLTGDRDAIYQDRTVSAKQIGRNCLLRFTESVIKEDLGNGETIELGVRVVAREGA